jgi:hypothetical protein
MHLLLFRFLPGSQMIELPFLQNFDLPTLFVSAPPAPKPPHITPDGQKPPTMPAIPDGPAPGSFHGPTSSPNVKGPSGPPPNI